MKKLLVGAVLVAFWGCGPGESEVLSVIRSNNDSNGKRLANLYYIHQTLSPRREGPRDEAGFREFISSIKPEQLAEMNVDAGRLDDLFISERDGEPFLVRYGVVMPGLGGGHHQAVIFERQGQRGQISVYMTGPKVIDIPVADSAAYQQGLHDILGIPPEPPGE